MADRVLPTVPLLFPCQQAQHESGEVLVLNPWAAVALPEGTSFPIDVEEVWVYAQLTDGVGTFRLSVEMRQRLDDGAEQVIGESEWVTLDFPGAEQLHVYDAIFRMRDVPFDGPGLYEFRVLADGEELDGHVPTLRLWDQGTPL